MTLDNDVTILNVINSVAITEGNYLPNGTSITVELDGTGDFTSIEDAINYLVGKTSNGTVTIQIGNGNHIVNDILLLNGAYFNIPFILFKGKGKTNTTITSNSQNTTDTAILRVTNSTVKISDISFTRTTNSDYDYGLGVSNFGKLILDNVKVSNCKNRAVEAYNSGLLHLNSIEIDNCDSGIVSTCSTITGTFLPVITASNLNWLFCVWGGGIIQFGDVNLTRNNVNNLYNQSNATLTTNGFISIHQI